MNCYSTSSNLLSLYRPLLPHVKCTNVTWRGCILFEPLYRLCALSAEQKETHVHAGECFRHTHILIILCTCAYSYSPGCDGRAAVEVAEAEQSLQTRILCRNIVELQTLDNREDHVLGLRSGTDLVSNTASSGSFLCVACACTHPIGPPSTSLLRQPTESSGEGSAGSDITSSDSAAVIRVIRVCGCRR
jgi:hypothetical protein